MNVLILMGSPRLNGNTAELCKPFINELISKGASVRYVELAKKNIAFCKGCYACQNVADEYGCVQKDDMFGVVQDILWADFRNSILIRRRNIYEIHRNAIGDVVTFWKIF